METNKLIAEFMGFTKEETNNLGVIWYDNEETYLMISSRFENSNCFDEDQLNFHKSWDLLKPVVDEIEMRCQGVPQELLHLSLFSTRQEVYQAIVEFIKFYNKNK